MSHSILLSPSQGIQHYYKYLIITLLWIRSLSRHVQRKFDMYKYFISCKNIYTEVWPVSPVWELTIYVKKNNNKNKKNQTWTL
jgi:hypothetical protein